MSIISELRIECDDFNPQLIAQQLDLQPSCAEPWTLTLPQELQGAELEQQIQHWAGLFAGKKDIMDNLIGRGYAFIILINYDNESIDITKAMVDIFNIYDFDLTFKNSVEVLDEDEEDDDDDQDQP